MFVHIAGTCCADRWDLNLYLKFAKEARAGRPRDKNNVSGHREVGKKFKTLQFDLMPQVSESSSVCAHRFAWMYESSWRKSLQFKEWSESNFLKCSAPGEPLTDYVKTTWQSSSDESSEECYQLNLQLLLASLSFISESAFCLAAWT